MQCESCSFFGRTPQELFEHMISFHGMTMYNTPPHLQHLWASRGVGGNGGFPEMPDPLTGKAPKHQIAAQGHTVISLFNPNVAHQFIAQPLPENWQQVAENNYVIMDTLLETPIKKIWIEGRLTPGHGVVYIKKTENVIIHSQIPFVKPTEEQVNDERILAQDFHPYSKSPDYLTWEKQFADDVVTKINIIKAKLMGTGF